MCCPYSIKLHQDLCPQLHRLIKTSEQREIYQHIPEGIGFELRRNSSNPFQTCRDGPPYARQNPISYPKFGPGKIREILISNV